MRILVTGLTGFAGNHLARELLGAGHDVVAQLRTDIVETPPPGVAGAEAELTDVGAMRRLIVEVAPEGIIHLAGAASVGQSFGAPEMTWRVNLWGTLALLEAMRLEGSTAPCVTVTSGEIHGHVPPEALPITPDTPLNPVSPYGASKAAADLCAAQYRAAYGLRVLRVRAFNHIGPGQDGRFVIPSVARQIAEAERSGTADGVIQLGNLDVRRDFSDVRDIVCAYRLVLERGDPDHVYVAASGGSRSIRSLVDGLVAQSRVPITVHSDASLRRDGEPEDLWGDPSFLRADTGWEPRHTIEETLRDVLDWWRGGGMASA